MAYKLPATACPETVQFVIEYCKENLGQYGLSHLYLFGSRAYGSPRDNSDHDFAAVVSDAAPAEVSTGRAIHTQIFGHLNRERIRAGLKGIDLLIFRQSYFLATADEDGTFAHAAATRGIVLYG